MRQLSLDQFENESRRMVPVSSDPPPHTKKFTRQKSPQGLHKKVGLQNYYFYFYDPLPFLKVTKIYMPLLLFLSWQVISTLLRPRNWKPPVNRRFFLDSYEVGELCHATEQIFMNEPTVLQLKAPVKVFGDLHGQFGDLMRLFDEYGFPSTAGDIT